MIWQRDYLQETGWSRVKYSRYYTNQVVVKKQVCIVGHSFVRRLRTFVDFSKSRDMDRQFGLDLVRVAWHGIGGLGIDLLRCSGRDFV